MAASPRHALLGLLCLSALVVTAPEAAGEAGVSTEVVGAVETIAPRGAPADAPGPGRSGEDVEVFEIDELTVIHRYVPGSGLVATNLYLLGGVRQITESTAGIEPLLLNASERGTRDYPGTAVLEAQVHTGSRFVVSSTPDWTVFGFRGLADEFERSWSVFADRLMHPVLDSTSVSIARAQMLSRRRAGSDDPNGEVLGMAAAAAYSGHPYARSVSGTEASLARITVADLRAYHAEHTVKSRMLVAVVGDVSRDRVEAQIRKTIARLPAGSFDWGPPASWAGERPSVKVRQRSLPTNYIAGYFGGPPATSDEYPAFRLTVAVVSSIVHQSTRSQGLSYAAGAYPLERAASGGAIYVTTSYPERSIEVVNDVIELLRWVVPRKSLLEDYAHGFITGYWLDNETHSAQADFLARSYLFRGKPRTPEEFVRELQDVPPDAVRRMTARYIKNIQYSFLGDTTQVPRGEMKEY